MVTFTSKALLVSALLVAAHAQNGLFGNLGNGGNSGEMFETAAAGLAGAANGFGRQNNGQGNQGLNNQRQWGNQQPQVSRRQFNPAYPVNNINNAFGRQNGLGNQLPNPMMNNGANNMWQFSSSGRPNTGMGNQVTFPNRNGMNNMAGAPIGGNRFTTFNPMRNTMGQNRFNPMRNSMGQNRFSPMGPNAMGQNRFSPMGPNAMGQNRFNPTGGVMGQNRLGSNSGWNTMNRGFGNSGRWNMGQGQTMRPAGFNTGNSRFAPNMMQRPGMSGQFNRFGNNANTLPAYLSGNGNSDGDWTDLGVFS